tara:strand:+ start:255 stop:953 length:699 start_codon:yes stop_codon:yes gene_type:complete
MTEDKLYNETYKTLCGKEWKKNDKASGNNYYFGGTLDPTNFTSSYFLNAKSVILTDGTELDCNNKYGYLALMDKVTGEYHMINMYGYDGYSNTFERTSTTSYDTSDNKWYRMQVYSGQTISYLRNALRARYRKELSEYSLVALEVKRNTALPYYEGRIRVSPSEGNSHRIRYMGPSPLTRTQVEIIVATHVLVESIDIPPTGEVVKGRLGEGGHFWTDGENEIIKVIQVEAI